MRVGWFLLASVFLGNGCLGRGNLVWVSSQVMPAQVAQGRELAAEFSRRTGITVVYKNGVAREELAKMLARGGSVDVVMVSSPELETLAAAGWLTPLKRLSGKELGGEGGRFYAGAAEAGKVGEEVYGLPLYIDVPVVYYNREVFQRFGVAAPGSGWGWDDYVGRAKALTRDTDGDGTPDVCGIYRGGELAALVSEEGVRLFSVGAAPEERRCTVNSAAVRGLLEFYLSLEKQHRVCPPPSSQSDPLRYFSAGKAAMLTSSAAWAADVEASTDFAWEIAPAPATRFGKRRRALCVNLASIPRGCRHKREARRFIEFASSWKGWGRVGGIPAARSVGESEEFLGSYPSGMKKVVEGLGGFLPPRTGSEREFLRTVWPEEVDRLLKGQQSMERTLLEMERRGNELVIGE